jgi:hypothetical protein
MYFYHKPQPLTKHSLRHTVHAYQYSHVNTHSILVTGVSHCKRNIYLLRNYVSKLLLHLYHVCIMHTIAHGPLFIPTMPYPMKLAGVVYSPRPE